MIEDNKKSPADRLAYNGSLAPVIKRLSAAYQIGGLTDFSVIGVGYEDCNVVVETEQGKFVAKIFSKVRTQQDIARYASIMEKVVETGVNHPPLLRNSDGQVTYVDPYANGISLVLMDFIEGETFFELNRAPDNQERQEILEQAARINRLPYHPPYIFDSWAIPNIRIMLDRTGQFIEPEDLKLVEEVLRRYNAIPLDGLPQCFVHGDFTKANVLKAKNGALYILDFSVANWYPRIQELAVIAANLLHEDNNQTSLSDKCALVAEEYSRLNPLTKVERLHLQDYALAGVVMEFMGSHQEKYLHGNDTDETDYWFNLGREELRKELS